MLKRLTTRVSSFLAASVIVSRPQIAKAFDPFTAITAVGGVVTAISKGKEEVDDLADLGFSFTGLIDDLEIDSSADEKLKAQVDRINDLNRKANEISEEGFKLRDQTGSLAEVSKLQSKVRLIRDMIRTSKTLATLMPGRSKATEKALKIQDTKINYLMLEELQKQREAQLAMKLEAVELKSRVTVLRERLKSEERRM